MEGIAVFGLIHESIRFVFGSIELQTCEKGNSLVKEVDHGHVC